MVIYLRKSWKELAELGISSLLCSASTGYVIGAVGKCLKIHFFNKLIDNTIGLLDYYK